MLIFTTMVKVYCLHKVAIDGQKPTFQTWLFIFTMTYILHNVVIVTFDMKHGQ